MPTFLPAETTEEIRQGLHWLGEHGISASQIRDCRDEINEYGVRPEEFFPRAMQDNHVLAIGDSVIHEHRPMALRLLPGLKNNGATHIFVRAHCEHEQEWINHFMLFGKEMEVAHNHRVRHHAVLLREARRLGFKLQAVYDNSQSNWTIACEFLDDWQNHGAKLIFWDAARRLRTRDNEGNYYPGSHRLSGKYDHCGCSIIGLRSPLCPNALDPTPWTTFIAGSLQFPVAVPTFMATSLAELPVSSIIQDKLSCWDYVIIYPQADHRQLEEF